MNLDYLKRFYNQIIEQRPQECVGEAVADVVGNITGQPMTAGFSYAAALKVANSLPTTAGSDPYSGMLGAFIYGCLPTENEPFDATKMGELYESNFANYASDLKLLARNYAQGFPKALLTYDDIARYLMEYRKGVVLTIKWYEAFISPNPDGSLPEPKGNYLVHCVPVYEDTILGLRFKPGLGPQYGDSGYGYLNRRIFNSIFVSAYGFDPDAIRWVQLAKIAATRRYLILDILPQLISKS